MHKLYKGEGALRRGSKLKRQRESNVWGHPVSVETRDPADPIDLKFEKVTHAPNQFMCVGAVEQCANERSTRLGEDSAERGTQTL